MTSHFQSILRVSFRSNGGSALIFPWYADHEGSSFSPQSCCCRIFSLDPFRLSSANLFVASDSLQVPVVDDMDTFPKSQSAWATRSLLTSYKLFRGGIAAFLFISVLLYLYIDTSFLKPTTHSYSALQKSLHSTSGLARNRTLGFQKIFYISLP